MPAPADWKFARDSHRGIPMFYDPEPDDELTGVLTFRVGRSDEQPPRNGITHLVEHLALYGMREAQFEYNGSVGPVFTTFVAIGTPEEVAGFLREVARALHDLPTDRVRDEARILRAEALGHATSLIQEALWYRCGNRGHGVGYMNELLLHSPDPELVRSWAAGRFTAGNAALTFNGPPPPDLDVNLPAGPARPAAAVEPLADVSWPACVNVSQPRIGLTMIGQRAPALMAVQDIATRRIHRVLRQEQSLIYALQHTYDVLNHDTALLGAWTECMTPNVVQVRDTILSTYATLAREGPGGEELARFADPPKFATDRPGNRQHYLTSAVVNALLGAPVLQPEDYVREHSAVDAAQVAKAASRLLDTALLSQPAGFAAPRGFVAYPFLSRGSVRGRVHRSIKARWPWEKSEELVVGTDGVSLIMLNGGAHTVKFEECVAAVLAPGDILTVVGEDGFTIHVDSSEWRDGARAVARIVEALPRERILLMGRD